MMQWLTCVHGMAEWLTFVHQMAEWLIFVEWLIGRPIERLFTVRGQSYLSRLPKY
jgi:hypothetical protein